MWTPRPDSAHPHATRRRLPFQTNQFDAVCLCSVPFLLRDSEPLLAGTLRITDPDGELGPAAPAPARQDGSTEHRLGSRHNRYG
jgi:SAM-dependent methyltransferase